MNAEAAKPQAKKSGRVAAEDDLMQPLTYQLSAALRWRGCVGLPTNARAEYPRATLTEF